MAISSDHPPNWADLFKLAKIIPRLCNSVNRSFEYLKCWTIPPSPPPNGRHFLCVLRLVWVFGGEVPGPITEVTPTRLTNGVLATLRVADNKAMSVLAKHGEYDWVKRAPGKKVREVVELCAVVKPGIVGGKNWTFYGLETRDAKLMMF